MNPNFHGSAKIYQFPVRGRATTLGTRRDETTLEITASRVSEAACDSGWYHQAAIDADAKRTGEH
jgi:hypothetical protein